MLIFAAAGALVTKKISFMKIDTWRFSARSIRSDMEARISKISGPVSVTCLKVFGNYVVKSEIRIFTAVSALHFTVIQVDKNFELMQQRMPTLIGVSAC